MLDLQFIKETLKALEAERYYIQNQFVRVLRIAKANKDLDVIIFLELNKVNIEKGSISNLYESLEELAKSKGIVGTEYNDFFLAQNKKYASIRTVNWYEIKENKISKDKVIGMSVSSLSHYLEHIEKIFDANKLPEGLNPLDLYFENEKKQKSDTVYLNHISNCKTILNSLRDYLIDYLMDVEEKIMVEEEKKDMDVKQELEFLMQEGHDVKKKCFVRTSEGIYDHISGADYVAWIERCKMFIKSNGVDKEVYEKFLSYSEKANGNGDEYFDGMIGVLASLKNYNFTKEEVHKLIDQPITKVFVSHSSKDAKYVVPLVQLLNDIGVKKNDDSIFCSSLPGYDIPHGENIYDFLKRELNQSNVMVLFVLSHNYYNSPPSLNEMGAAWINSKESNFILTPNFEFNKIEGAINPTQISLKMNDSNGLDKFKDKIVEILNLEGTDYRIWAQDKQKFLAQIEEISSNEGTKMSTNIILEKVRKSNGVNVELQLRFINHTDRDIEFKYIDFELLDSKGDKLKLSVEDHLLDGFYLYSDENKVIKWSFKNDSSYEPRRDDRSKTVIDFEIYE